MGGVGMWGVQRRSRNENRIERALEEFFREHHHAIDPAFSLADEEAHIFGIDVLNAEMKDFGQTQPAGVGAIRAARYLREGMASKKERSSSLVNNTGLLTWARGKGINVSARPTFRTLKTRFARIIPDTLLVRGAVGAGRHGQKP